MSSRRGSGHFVGRHHDHDRCISEALHTAEAVCERRGLKLTPTRRRVLELVWSRHGPVGAYDLLSEIAKAGRSSAPPTVYRALEFLIDAGLVHRIDSLNAFLGCDRAAEPHAGQFLVCRNCKRVAEVDDQRVERAARLTARDADFTMDAPIEIKGLCKVCRSEGAPN